MSISRVLRFAALYERNEAHPKRGSFVFFHIGAKFFLASILLITASGADDFCKEIQRRF